MTITEKKTLHKFNQQRTKPKQSNIWLWAFVVLALTWLASSFIAGYFSYKQNPTIEKQDMIDRIKPNLRRKDIHCV